LKPNDQAFWVVLSRFLLSWQEHLTIIQPDRVIRNHLTEIVAVDFFTVHGATLKTLYVILVLSLDRRKIIHLNVTTNPNPDWSSLQLIQAFPLT